MSKYLEKPRPFESVVMAELEAPGATAESVAEVAIREAERCGDVLDTTDYAWNKVWLMPYKYPDSPMAGGVLFRAALDVIKARGDSSMQLTKGIHLPE